MASQICIVDTQLSIQKKFFLFGASIEVIWASFLIRFVVYLPEWANDDKNLRSCVLCIIDKFCQSIFIMNILIEFVTKY